MSATDMTMPASSFRDGDDIQSDLDLARSDPETVILSRDVKIKFSQMVQTVVGPEVPERYEAAAMRRVHHRLKEVAVELSRIHYRDHTGDCYDKHFDVDFEVKLTRTAGTL